MQASGNDFPVLAEKGGSREALRAPSTRDGAMNRPILLTCAGVLLAACASGADVAEDDASPDSSVVEVLEGTAPEDTSKQTP